MLREGTHQARVCAFDPIGYSNSGTPQVAVQFTTEEGSITWWGYLSDKAAKRTIGALRTMGWRGKDPGTITAGDLCEPVEIVVEHEEYNGQTKAKVKWINRPGGGGIKASKPIGDEQLKALLASLAEVCAEVPPLDGVVPKSGDDLPPEALDPDGDGEADAHAAQGDDDVPF